MYQICELREGVSGRPERLPSFATAADKTAAREAMVAPYVGRGFDVVLIEEDGECLDALLTRGAETVQVVAEL